MACRCVSGSERMTVRAKKKRRLTEQEQRRKEMQELIELKKMRQAAQEGRELGEGEGLTFEHEEELRPKTFKQKWKNYWYHYKMRTWMTVVFVVLGVWFIKDMFFSPKPDLSIGVATYTGVSYFTEAIDEDLAEYAADYNEDGQIYIAASESYFSMEDIEMSNAYYQKFVAELSAGSQLVYILDDYTYDMVMGGSDGESMFIDFGELYPDVDYISGDKIDITDHPLGVTWHLSSLGDIEVEGYPERRYYLCIRFLGNSAKDNEENRAELDRALDFVNNIVSATNPEYQDNRPHYDVDYDIQNKND